MKRAMITTSLFAILLLLLAPAIPALQRTTVLEGNTAILIRHAQNINKNELEGKICTIDCLIPKEIKKNLTTSEAVQKIKELLPNEFQDVVDKFLSFLLLCALVAYLITYAIGGSLGYVIDIILYLVTQGKWEFLRTTNIALIPSEFFFSIMIAIYSIGMKLCDWPFPDDPRYH
jgi:hypothetical protein